MLVSVNQRCSRPIYMSNTQAYLISNFVVSGGPFPLDLFANLHAEVPESFAWWGERFRFDGGLFCIWKWIRIVGLVQLALLARTSAVGVEDDSLFGRHGEWIMSGHIDGAGTTVTAIVLWVVIRIRWADRIWSDKCRVRISVRSDVRSVTPLRFVRSWCHCWGVFL